MGTRSASEAGFRLVASTVAAVALGLLFGARGADAAPSLVSRFDPQLGRLVAIAYDDVSGNVFVYGELDTEIFEYTPAGVAVPPPIPFQGNVSNDVDLDFAPEALDVGGTPVAANSLLQVNSDDNPDTFRALNKDTGSPLASVDLAPIVGGSFVGGSYHAARDTLFAVNWSLDIIGEYNTTTGGEIATFPVQPVGSPVFDIFYGDVDVVQATGNLLVVSSPQAVIRELTPTGGFVREYDVSQVLDSGDGMTGIAVDDASGDVWLSTFGDVYRINLDGPDAPVQGETANLAPVSGTVTVDVPGDGQGFIPIEQATQIPIGTTVDTTEGRVALTTDKKRAGTQTAEFYDGTFKVSQGKRSDETTLRLRGRQDCAGKRSDRTPLTARKRKPKLWGSGSGNFTSQGNHGSASVRGTKWLLFESCGGITGVQVKQGVVAFRNFYTDRTTLVRRGEAALAEPPK